jgi:hypothetical protein
MTPLKEKVGTLSKTALETTIQQQERLNGPLVDLTVQNGQTVLTLDTDGNPPAKALIDTYTTSNPPDKAGLSVVLKGTAIVDGQTQNVAVYRPST